MVEARNSSTIINIFKDVNDEIACAVRLYEEKFGIGLVWVVQVPARLCLAADHTDYWMGFTPELITMASDSQSMIAIIGSRDDSIVSCHSNNEKFENWDVDINENKPIGNDWLNWLENKSEQKAHWSNYVIGAVKYSQMFDNIKFGFNMVITSTIPPAAGASSSSALSICAMFATKLTNSLPINKLDMVKQTSEAEWFCGTRGGMMDHATMMFGERGKVLKLSFNPFSTHSIKLPNQIEKCKFTLLFTHSSEKSKGVLCAFNELAFIAREIVPRLLGNNLVENWRIKINQLPEKITKDEILDLWGDDIITFQNLYPVLFENDFEIKIRDRFFFAMNEYERSKKMQRMLCDENCTIEEIANVMNEAWHDSGQFYGIRTELMDEFAKKAREIDGVLGIKVMGAGFGGNLLIISRNNTDLSKLGSERLLECHAGNAARIIDPNEHMPQLIKQPNLAAILLCGGKGTRMLSEGITTHKPLLELNGTPATKLVIKQLLESKLSYSQIIVVVPPSREKEYHEEMEGMNVKIIVQEHALGTGNAVYCAIDELLSPIEQIYVSFGTQPLVRNQTIKSSLAHHIQSRAGFTLPTTMRNNPYAPLIRDENGVIVGSLETHLDGVETPLFGETNVGGYWVSKHALNDVLVKIHDELYDKNNNIYKTNSGELGFPNEMTAGCIKLGLGVEGIAIADPEEVIGLKTPEQIEVIEKWLKKRTS